MKRWMFGITTAALSAVQAFAVPFNASQIGSGARWVLHVDADQLRTTLVGQAFLQQLATGPEAAKLDALTLLIGSDLRRDLSGVTLYGASDREEDGVVLVQGKFNAQQLTTLAKANDGYTAQAYRGTTIHTWPDAKKGPGKSTHAAILPSGMVVFGGSDGALKAALDAATGQAPTLAVENRFGLRTDSANGQSVFMAAADLAGLKNAKAKANAQTIRQARSGAVTIGQTGGDVVAHVHLESDSPENAQKMHDAVRGLIAIVQLSDEADAQTKNFAESVQLQQQGQNLDITLTRPAQQVADWLVSEMAKKAKSKAAAPQNKE
jgi:hypothetical protein